MSATAQGDVSDGHFEFVEGPKHSGSKDRGDSRDTRQRRALSTGDITAAALVATAMNRLARTRSQHFVASPRRVGTPLKHKASLGRLHTTKRRRVVSGTGGNVNGNGSTRLSTEIVTVSDSEDEADLEVDGDGDETDQTSATTASHSDASKRSNGAPLDSQAGSQRANRRPVPRQVRGKAKPGGVITVLNDVFGDEGNISPRKRKRGSAATTPLQAASPGRSGSDTGDSGSWIEVDEGEHDQGEIIGESKSALILSFCSAHIQVITFTSKKRPHMPCIGCARQSSSGCARWRVCDGSKTTRLAKPTQPWKRNLWIVEMIWKVQCPRTVW